MAAILAFFSGFGLGAILTPISVVFFPIDLSIALTGVVHFFNNLFKLLLVGKHADKQVVIRFGIPVIVAVFAGTWLLLNITELPPLFSYSAGAQTFGVTLVKLIISLLLILFALMNLISFFENLQFGKEKLPLGGALSGFFGSFRPS